MRNRAGTLAGYPQPLRRQPEPVPGALIIRIGDHRRDAVLDGGFKHPRAVPGYAGVVHSIAADRRIPGSDMQFADGIRITSALYIHSAQFPPCRRILRSAPQALEEAFDEV